MVERRAVRLFISYASEDASQKDRLLTAIAAMIFAKEVEVWHDRQIGPGDEWKKDIFQRMEWADAALLLVSKNFLASKFINEEEIPVLLKRNKEENFPVLPILLDDCHYKPLKIVEERQFLSGSRTPISEDTKLTRAWANIARRLDDKLSSIPLKPDALQTVVLDTPPVAATSLSLTIKPTLVWTSIAQRLLQFLNGSRTPISKDKKPTRAWTNIARRLDEKLPSIPLKPDTPQAVVLDTSPPVVATALSLAFLLEKLPQTSPRLFGREGELGVLDGVRKKPGVLVWVAGGGTGKSALVRHWLVNSEFDGGTRFLGHSFYSQGTKDQNTTSAGFLREALLQW